MNYKRMLTDKSVKSEKQYMNKTQFNKENSWKILEILELKNIMNEIKKCNREL